MASDKEIELEDTGNSIKTDNKAKPGIEYVNTNPNIKTQVHHSGERVSLYHQLRYNKQHGLLPAQQDRLSKKRNKSGSSSYSKGTVAKYYSDRKERLRRLEEEKQRQIELGLQKFRIYCKNNNQRKASLSKFQQENKNQALSSNLSNDAESKDFSNRSMNQESSMGLTINNSPDPDTNMNPKVDDSKACVIKRWSKRKKIQI